MLAKLKKWVTKKQLKELGSVNFDWYLKILKKDKKVWTVYLKNWFWYKVDLLEFKKESWGSRYRKPKQEVVKVEDSRKEIDIDIWRVNMELKVWEYETRIKQLNKECESWMEDFNNAKKEKLEFEHKYNEVSVKNESLSKRISLLVELQEQLRNKKNMWKTLFLINITIDIVYLLIKYLWI